MAPSNEVGVPDDFKQSHFVTYWIKRLILHFLHAKQGKYVDTEEFIQIFSGRHRRAYPEILIRYLLGSLSQVPQAECIAVDIGASGGGGNQFYIKRMRLTRRGEFLITHFADSFAYLQLVVDDWRLRIPREIYKEFEYPEFDYSYLVSDRAGYAEQVGRVLRHKARQTVMFALFLEEFLEQEKKLYPRVFDRLVQEGVKLPSRDQLISRVCFDLDRITRNTFNRRGAYDAFCNSEFLNHDRSRIKSIVNRLVGPQWAFRREIYGDRGH